MLAASDLDAVAGRLRSEFGLGEPFSDPGVEYFGLRNAVFALDDTFLEVVSPIRADTPAGRLLERRGGDCGYMVMFQVDDFVAARSHARDAGVREVFEVSLRDMVEVHLHPADMRGAIVSLSQPSPPQAWRWGGPEWERRSARLRVVGATIALADPQSGSARWRSIVGELPGVGFERGEADAGLVEITVAAPKPRDPAEIGGVRFTFKEDSS